ncbi:hypothetical protein MNBD_ALPHA12-1876 [hydrothermal vent metagenome]|uniref:SHOCT domain-containing protein n=1 Tax=hydrothermal vent metagenome TaxID=652676 RepID=A0A3B0UAA8_9ZZZZ
MKPFIKSLAFFAGIALLPVQAALAQSAQNAPYIATWGYEHMGYGGWFFGPLMMLLVLGVFVGAFVLILKLLGIGGQSSSSRSALELLDERFARGEIDRQEYEERRSTLKN